jgi:hypothetical protein
VKNLLQSGGVLIEEKRTNSPAARSGQNAAPELGTVSDTYNTGSIWIDPETHRIMQIGPDGNITKSKAIYAVGAMTRGQIINASMVRGIVQAASRVADDLIGYLTRINSR